MKHKLIGYGLAVLVIVVSVMIMKKLTASKEVAERKDPPKITRSVRILEYSPANIPVEVQVNGKLASMNKIEIFSEVTGKVLSDNGKFREGSAYNQSDVLLHIDNSDASSALIALRTGFQSLITQVLPDIKLDYTKNYSNWEKYLTEYNAQKSVGKLPEPFDLKEKQFLTIKNVYNQYYNILSQEEKLSKYTVRAPFSGVLSASLTQQGSIVRPGQKLGELIQPGFFELKVPVNVQNLKYLKTGQSVSLQSEDFEGAWSGVIKRIGKSIDPQTQSISVYLQIRSNDLKDGMYLSGTIKGEVLNNSFSIPRKLLLEDKSIFVVESAKLNKVKPTILKINESDVIISGLSKEVNILNESFVGAFVGMEVKPITD